MNNLIESEQESSPSKGYRIFEIIRTVFVYLLAVVIIVAALLFAASANPSKSLFGYRYYTVLTPSMEPAYSVGDMVFVKIEKADNINVGDVITFNPSSEGDAYLTHRVVEKMSDYKGTGLTCFRTKGDANDSEDTFLIDEERVIGVVNAGIPWLGYIVRFVQLRWYYIVPICALIFVFFKLMGIYLSPSKNQEAVAEVTSESVENSGEAPSESESASETEANSDKSESEKAEPTPESENSPEQKNVPESAPEKDGEKAD